MSASAPDDRNDPQSAGNPLQDWFRYVESVARPAAAPGESEEAPPPRAWRSWSEVQSERTADSAGGDPAERASQFMERLVPRLPTVAELEEESRYELPPLPEFPVPELKAPRLRLRIRRLAGFLAPARAAEVGAKGGRAAAPAWAAGRDDRLAHHWRLLQLPADDVTQNSYKSRFDETRDELLERLLNPALTLAQTSRLLGVCPTTIRRYTNKGLLRHFRTNGNQRRFHLMDVLDFLERRAEQISADARNEAAGSPPVEEAQQPALDFEGSSPD